ncbi:MAG: N-acetylglucosamine-6-phosphate deacetylase [Candidatus Promineifilaceae bacterium]|nr:N-acetylglucosamine-6-phosphate deacetylase [Candidatus Promineifilaceae bacterium]
MHALSNVTILTPERTIRHGVVLVDEGRISHVGQRDSVTVPPQAEVIDSRGALVAPGLIDLQLNGAFGHDFTSDPTAMWTAAAELPRYGVTAFLPAIISTKLDTVEGAQDVWLGGPPADFRGAQPLGLHLEGPYLNPEYRGAHRRAHLRLPNLDDLVHWSPATGVRLVTLAPELPRMQWLISLLAERGILVGAGHSAATFEEARQGFDAGVRYVPHLFNAMSGLHQRRPGLVGAALADERVSIGLIADGVHVHPAVVKLIWQLTYDGRLNLVSDATAGLGMPPGSYRLGDQPVTVEGGRVERADGTLAGTVLRLDQALRNLQQYTGCALTDALAAVTATPARLLGLGRHKGQVRPGFDADLVLLNADLQPTLTMVAGEIVYRAAESG